jgi:tetratricopeptide (TPR) repeat protein
MSLLLDALKDADGRRNKPTGTAATAGAPRPANETHVLAILEETSPEKAPPAATAPATAAPTGRAEQVASERPARRPLAGGAGRKPGGMRRFMLPVLLVVTVLGIAAGYLYLAGGQDLPKLMPAALPAPVASAITDAPPVEGEEDVKEPRSGHVQLEPGLEPEVPKRAEAVAAPGVRTTEPQPEPAPAQEAPVIKTVRSTPAVENSSDARLQQAYAALRAGDLTAAEAGYREALRHEPHQVDAHLGLAVMAQARGNGSLALTHYRAVLESVPDHARAWSGLSDLAGAQELEGMESRLRGLIASRPAATLQFALGNVLSRQSRWAEAQESYFRAASGESGNAEYAFNLAVALDHLGKRDASITWYGRALDLARDGRPVQFNAVSATQRLDTLREASR